MTTLTLTPEEIEILKNAMLEHALRYEANAAEYKGEWMREAFAAGGAKIGALRRKLEGK